MQPEFLEAVTAFGSVATALATMALAFFGVRQITALREENRLQRESERKWATLDVCVRYSLDRRINEAEEIIFACINQDPRDDANISARLIESRRAVKSLLNYLDNICIGIYQGAYIKEIVKDHLEALIIAATSHFIDRWKVVSPDDFHYLLKFRAELEEDRKRVTYAPNGSL